MGKRKAIAAAEIVHMPMAIAFADAALKSANVSLIGYERSKCSGNIVIKLEGELSALQAAVEAGKAVAGSGELFGVSVIPRPLDSLDFLIRNKDTVGYQADPEPDPEPENPPPEPENPPPAPKPEDPQPIPEPTEQPPEATAEPEVTAEPEAAEESAADAPAEYTCNRCLDPQCSRKRGEPHRNCIHYVDAEN